jgi:CheY-like chemotaxis protein
MKVLLVDDQAYSFSPLEGRLKEMGCELVRRTDASEGFQEALALDKAGELKLIILDIIMKAGPENPDWTGGREAGVALAERLRKEGVNVPIIFYTVVSDAEITDRAARVTGSRYVGKIAAKSIADIVARTLERKK